MKGLKCVIGIFVFLLFVPTVARCVDQDVILEIDYGGLQENRNVKIPCKQGMTALEALRSVAKIETQQLSDSILVTSIEGIEGKKGDRVWYYNINGKRATSFANKCILSAGDHMRWEYTKDVCSPKVNEEGSKSE